MTVLELNPEVYGERARYSSLADVLEIFALQGNVVRRSHLENWLSKNSYSFDFQILLDPSAGDDDQENYNYEDFIDWPEDFDDDDSLTDDDSVEHASRVFALFDERATILNERYPFTVRAESLTVKAGVSIPTNIYAHILALTVAHAHKIRTGAKLTDLFEEVVVQYFSSGGWRAAQMGKNRGKIEKAMEDIAPRVNLPLYPNTVVRSRYANDDKVDVLAHWDAMDDRQGRMTAIGQVTIGQSSSWEKKAKEPSEAIWSQYMADHCRPKRFFAVPHHIEPLTLQRLVQDSESVVVDRLRIANRLAGVVPPALVPIYNKVMKALVEFE